MYCMHKWAWAEEQSLNTPTCQTVFDTHYIPALIISYACYCRHHAKKTYIFLFHLSPCPFSTPLLSAVIVIDRTSLLNNLHDLKIFVET